MTVNATDGHRWVTVSAHLTSTGSVRYQRCYCGRHRILQGNATASTINPPALRPHGAATEQPIALTPGPAADRSWIEVCGTVDA